jgi:hypothetical protein
LLKLFSLPIFFNNLQDFQHVENFNLKINKVMGSTILDPQTLLSTLSLKVVFNDKRSSFLEQPPSLKPLVTFISGRPEPWTSLCWKV